MAAVVMDIRDRKCGGDVVGLEGVEEYLEGGGDGAGTVLIGRRRSVEMVLQR
jgi:hypothetical protein